MANLPQTIKVKAEGKKVQTLSFQSALNLLRTKGSKWTIADSNYIFKDNEIQRRKPSTGDSKESEE